MERADLEAMPFEGLGTEASLRAFADALPDGLFTTDLHGSITFWNRAAARITGWSPEEALGKSCALLAGDAVNGCSCGAGPARCGMAELGYVSRCCAARTKDGRHVLLVKKAVPFFTGDRQLAGALETFTEIGTAPLERRDGAGAREVSERRLLGLVGDSPAMRELNRMIALVARSDSNVLVQGESGTGKERVVEAIHASGKRASRPLARVHCSAASDDQLERELFGTGDAGARGRGLLEEAQDGTVLLDEISDLSPRLQGRILRVVAERAIDRIDAPGRAPMRARVVCTTQHDVRRLVAAGRFRADLFFRLSTLTLEVPPLRARPGDVVALAGALLGDVPGCQLTEDARRALETYAWPGNVRELHNTLHYALLRAAGGPIAREHLPPHLAPGGTPRTARRADPDREAIRAALAASRGNRAEAARRLGISRVTLWKRLKELDPGEPRGE
jgi:transcriptional regulator with PAS, ATPase and Fis domain